MAARAGDRLAVVFGGSGFVGRYAVRAFAKRGWRVRTAVRRPDLAGHLQPAGVVGQVHAVQANLRYEDSVRAAVEGATTVVNAVGVLAPVGQQTFDKLHVEGARAVARAAREAGAETFVHVSAIGADAASSAQYARTKGEGERAVLEEFPGAVILRPSIVFGREDQFFNRFAGLAVSAPFLPLIGGGKTKFQPVFVGDLADAIVAAAEGVGNRGAVYELGGPAVLSFRELLDRTQEWAGRKRVYLPLPFWAAKLQAVLTKPLPTSLRPITVDQVRMLQAGHNVVSAAAFADGRTIAALGVSNPTPVEAEVPLYLERFRPRGQFSHYRG